MKSRYDLLNTIIREYTDKKIDSGEIFPALSFLIMKLPFMPDAIKIDSNGDVIFKFIMPKEDISTGTISITKKGEIITFSDTVDPLYGISRYYRNLKNHYCNINEIITRINRFLTNSIIYGFKWLHEDVCDRHIKEIEDILMMWPSDRVVPLTYSAIMRMVKICYMLENTSHIYSIKCGDMTYNSYGIRSIPLRLTSNDYDVDVLKIWVTDPISGRFSYDLQVAPSITNDTWCRIDYKSDDSDIADYIKTLCN